MHFLRESPAGNGRVNTYGLGLKPTPLQKSRYLRNLCVGLCLGLILTPLQKSSYIRTCLLLPFLFLQSCTGTSAYLPRLLLCCSWYHANPVHLWPDTVAPLDLWLLEKMKMFLHKKVKNIRNSSEKVCVRLEPHFFQPRPATPLFNYRKKNTKNNQHQKFRFFTLYYPQGNKR